MAPKLLCALLVALPLLLSPARGDERPAALVQSTVLPKSSDPRRFEAEIAAFEKADQAQPPLKGSILFLGSSSIRLWKSVGEDFPNQAVINRGFGGSQVADSVFFFDRLVLPYQPRFIVFYAGGNDLNDHKTPAAVAGAFREFVSKVHTALPRTGVAYISIAPNPARWAQIEAIKETNDLIRAFCAEQPYLKFIDVFPHMLGSDGLPRPEIFRPDRLHMNADGYRIWTSVIGPLLPAPSSGVRPTSKSEGCPTPTPVK